MWLAAIGWPLLAFGAYAGASWRAAWQDSEAELARSAEASSEFAQRLLDGLLLHADLAQLLVAHLPDAEIRAQAPALGAALREVVTRRQPPGLLHLAVQDGAGALLVSDEAPVPADGPWGPPAADPAAPGSQWLGRVGPPGPEGRILVARRRVPQGLVIAALGGQAVQAGLDRLAHGGMGEVITLWHQDGQVLARSGSRTVPGHAPGDLSARQAVPGWPAFVTVERSRAAILVQWRDAALTHLAYGSPALLALLLLSLAARRRGRALARANQALAQGIAADKASHLRAGRQQAELLASMREVIYALDSDFRFAFVSRRALEVWQRPEAQLLGRPFLEVFPQATHSLAFQVQAEAMAERRETHLCIVSPVIGHWIEVDIYPREGGGVIVAFRDIEQLRAAQRQKGAAERRLRLATAAGRLGTFVLDLPRGTVTRSGRAVPEGPGLPIRDLPLEAWIQRVHPEDRAAVQLAVAEVASGQRQDYQIEYRIRRSDELPWQVIESHAVVTDRDPVSGRALLLVGVSRDVTEDRAAEARQRLMAREVDHRAKNALAVVQSVLRLTPRQDAAAFAQAVEGRVAALARAHTALAEARWQSAALRAVAEAELSAFQPSGGAARVILAGPELALAPEAVQALSMTLHELATNAAKHGALSTPEGRLRLSWSLEPDPERLVLEWREEGGPRLAGPPARRGFGSRLVRTTVEHQLGGRVEHVWAEDGLVCRITVPLARIRPRRGVTLPPD